MGTEQVLCCGVPIVGCLSGLEQQETGNVLSPIRRKDLATAL